MIKLLAVQISCVQSKGFHIFSKTSFFFSFSSGEQVQVVFTRCIQRLRAVAITSLQNSRFQSLSFSMTWAQPWPLAKSMQKYFICLGICFCRPPFYFSIRMILLCVAQFPSISSKACLKKNGKSSALALGMARHQIQICELSLENCSKKTTCRLYLSNAWMRHLRQLLSSVRVSSFRPILVCSWSTGARMRWKSPSKVLCLGRARQTQLEALSRKRSQLSGQNMQQSWTLFDAMMGRFRFLISFFSCLASSLPSNVMLQSNLPRAGAYGPGGCAYFIWDTFSLANSSSSCSGLPFRKRLRHSSKPSFSLAAYCSWKIDAALGYCSSSSICCVFIAFSLSEERTLLVWSSSYLMVEAGLDFLRPLSIFSFSMIDNDGCIGQPYSCITRGHKKANLILNLSYDSLASPERKMMGN